MKMKKHWLDSVVGTVSPRWQLKRLRDRITLDVVQRHYEGAATGRRTQGWRRSGGDANALIGPVLAVLRENARDLVRNNPYAESALSTIVDHTVGWGIVGKPTQTDKRVEEIWKAWAETTACDADGKHDFYGLQKLVKRTIVESGEVLVRRRLRRPEDGFPLPMQLQVLDPDFLDTSKDVPLLPNGGRIIQGVEFDPIGRRAGYWIFRDHPGSLQGGFSASVRVPAEGVLHIFNAKRPGQVRAPSWFAPTLLRFKDFDEFEDATLMKQKIAACLAVLITSQDGTQPPLGTAQGSDGEIDSLEPGMIKTLDIGNTVTVVDPPQVRDYEGYSKTVLRAIATGLGVTYEDLTGDYQDMPFSAARMSRLRHEARIHDWRWRVLIPQFCDPVWNWAMQIAVIFGHASTVPMAKWTPPPLPMINPSEEGLAAQRNIRTGISSLSEEIRARGYDPDELLAEIAADNAKLDKLRIILDSDARNMTQGGQLQGKAAAAFRAEPAPAPAQETDDERIVRLTPAHRTWGK